MRVWISGIAGFLGSHLADALIADGHVIDGNDTLICGDSSNISKRGFWRTDCRNQEVMSKIMTAFNPDVVVHCAATAHEGLSSFSPSFITKNIYEASVSTFSAAISAGVKRIVFMSSMARYGEGYISGNVVKKDGSIGHHQGAPFSEFYETRPIDPYGIAKVAAEQTLKVLCDTHRIKYSILVPHNIIGVRQRYNDPFRNVASIMINRCLSGKPPIVYGNGLQKRCFSPVADCIPSIVRAVNGAADGEVINIGPDSGEITILELAQKIMEYTNYTGEIKFMPDRPNEVKHAYCSSDKARNLLGYEPKQSIDACLKEMVADIQSKGAKAFDYSFPIEIEKGCPEVWLKKMM